jgi:cell division septation protein DedD
LNDTRHDVPAGDDGFHEIQLSGKQLVFLFMATTILAVVIFLCGVQVGRNVKGGDRLASIEPSEPVAAAAALTPPPASTPTHAAPSSGPPAAEPPAPEPDDELSYAKRLQQADPAAGDKIAKPPAYRPVDSRPAEPPPAPPKAEPKGAPIVVLPKTTPAPASVAASAQASTASTGQPGPWIVQVSATKDRTQAAGVARELAAKGYPAFVLDPTAGAPVIYRVQVGGYPDRPTADQAAHKLEKDEHYKPYVRSR